MNDLAKRRAIIDKLITEGQRFGLKHSGREITDNYTHVSGREKLLRWNEDEEPESGAIRAAVKQKLDDKFPKTCRRTISSKTVALNLAVGCPRERM